MKFLKKQDLRLINGGYLVDTTDTPVYQEEFITLQTEAHALFLLAEKVKKTDFTTKVAPSFEDLTKEVMEELNVIKENTYINKLEAPNLKTTEMLSQEALKWLNFEKQTSLNEKINKSMQKFNLINEFEEFGLYFSEDKIVKLPRIYTIQEILDSTTAIQPFLG